MIVAERPPVKHDSSPNPFKLDELLVDGRLTAGLDSEPVYDVRAAEFEVSRRGRPLTEEELRRYVL